MIDWDAQPLGEVSDAELARRLGLTTGGVFYQRKKRGISPLPTHQGLGINWDEQPLGNAADAELAKRLGCSRFTVREARTARGIHPFQPHRGPESSFDSMAEDYGYGISAEDAMDLLK